jgi:hypothetical protein
VSQRVDERPRSEARAWLYAHIPAGSRVVIEAYGPYIPQNPYRITWTTFAVRKDRFPRDTAAVVVTETGSGRFLAQPNRYSREVAKYRALTSKYCMAARWTDGPWVEVLTPCSPKGG